MTARRLDIPHSAASHRPATVAPACACDAHLHVFDDRFASQGAVPLHARASDYQRLQALLGTSRAVVVQPRLHGTDNAVTLDAIRQLGMANTRGIAVVRPDVRDEELAALHAGGIRGIRFSLYSPIQAQVGFHMVERLAQRVHALGWHLQLHWTADQIATHAAMLKRLPTPLVFDHLARLPLPLGTGHPAFGIVRSLLQAGRAWVKLSGAYLVTRLVPGAGYRDCDPIASAWIRTAPDHVVWGSDWPHVTQQGRLPDDAALFDLLDHWSAGHATRERILVHNPARLYGW